MPIFGGVGGAQTFSKANGGKVYPFNNINETTNTAILAGNPSRVTATFHNPGGKDIFISPTTDGNGNALAPTNAALGGAFRLFANGGTLVITGECQQAWQAIAVTGAGTTNALTVMESNVG